jgi:hypothetical protein
MQLQLIRFWKSYRYTNYDRQKRLMQAKLSRIYQMKSLVKHNGSTIENFVRVSLIQKYNMGVTVEDRASEVSHEVKKEIDDGLNY